MPHTHELTFNGPIVRKRFTSWGDGEADREWAALNLLMEHAPDLAPSPIARETDVDAPVIVMSLLPGEPLGGAKVSPGQTRALADALRRLFAVRVAPDVRERAWAPLPCGAIFVPGSRTRRT